MKGDLRDRNPNIAVFPQLRDLGDGLRFATTFGNWWINTGEDDDYGRPPLKAVFATHDCDDGGYRTFWADSFEEAVEHIKTMKDFGDDTQWDYR